ncbi:hypothetical protein [Herbiconiux daphne]|uniref:DUF1905 domain-containing protein n=1 Tax=Herbiconiux daphne TaxID=2970914 RepID=A0ABT2H202_9MICO|nr:hypothetical protein [Herbiconiux daphne]MCS5733944.1 hypothetical protein [Herbiconiux daphne]
MTRMPLPHPVGPLDHTFTAPIGVDVKGAARQGRGDDVTVHLTERLS